MELYFLKDSETEAGETYVCPIYKWIGQGRTVRNSIGMDIVNFPGGIGFCLEHYGFHKKLIVILNIYREDGSAEHYIQEASYVEQINKEYEKWQTDKLPLYPYDSHHGKVLNITFSFILHKDHKTLSSIYEYKFASIEDFYRGRISPDDFRDFIKYNEYKLRIFHPETVQLSLHHINNPCEEFPVKPSFTRGNTEDPSHPRHEIHRLIDFVIDRKKRDIHGRHYIHMSVFNFDNPYIADHLIHAFYEGVEVECVGGWEQVSSMDYIESVAKLRKHKIPVYGVVRNIPHEASGIASMHTKIIIFDGQASMSASFNLDFHIWGGNLENCVFHYSPHISVIYEHIYHAIKGAFYVSPHIDINARFNSFYSFAKYHSSDGKFYRAQDVIIREIRRAKHSIIVVMFDINYLPGFDEHGRRTDCIVELIKAKMRGVYVKIIFNGAVVETGRMPERWDKDYRRPLKEPVQSLVDAGIDVIRLYNTWDIFSPLHHKFAVFDEETVLTGSYNWYTVSAISDEEMSVIRDREIAGKYLEEVYLMLNSFRLKYG